MKQIYLELSNDYKKCGTLEHNSLNTSMLLLKHIYLYSKSELRFYIQK